MVPRGFDPTPYQPEAGYVNDHAPPLFPEVLQAHRDARPRGPDPGHYGFATPDFSALEPQFLPPPVQSQPSGGPSSGGPSYVFGTPRAPAVQVYVRQTPDQKYLPEQEYQSLPRA